MLLVIGCTGPMLSPLLRTRGFRRLRRLSHPVPALAIWLAALYAWHLPAAYEAALHHSAVHLLQHTCFFLAGLNLWVALLGPLPKPAWFIAPAKLGYVVVYWLGGAALGAALVFSGTVFYDTYAAHEGAAALGDQSSAGAIMMVEQAVVATCMVCWLFGVLWREASERQELVELAESRGIVLDEDRVARAVAAGRTAAVRRRITEGRRA
jgi:cytochrome c oxidase assembly factor CtaG